MGGEGGKKRRKKEEIIRLRRRLLLRKKPFWCCSIRYVYFSSTLKNTQAVHSHFITLYITPLRQINNGQHRALPYTQWAYTIAISLTMGRIASQRVELCFIDAPFNYRLTNRHYPHSLTHSLTYTYTHSLTHSLTYTYTHLHTHSHSHTHTHVHSCTHMEIAESKVSRLSQKPGHLCATKHKLLWYRTHTQ